MAAKRFWEKNELSAQESVMLPELLVRCQEGQNDKKNSYFQHGFHQFWENIAKNSTFLTYIV